MARKKPIEPIIGHPVHYNAGSGVMHMANVCAIHTPERVNLFIVDHNGTPYFRPNVTLVQGTIPALGEATFIDFAAKKADDTPEQVPQGLQPDGRREPVEGEGPLPPEPETSAQPVLGNPTVGGLTPADASKPAPAAEAAKEEFHEEAKRVGAEDPNETAKK